MNAIRRIRENRQVLQKELADELKIKRQTLWQYERNERQPRADTLSKIASVLHCTVDELLESS